MKLKTIDSLHATNESLQNRHYTIIGLKAEEIPIRKRPVIQEFLESIISETRNFFPGDLDHTIQLFNQVNGVAPQRETEPILLLAVQRLGNLDPEFLPITHEPLEEWLESKQKVARDAIAAEVTFGPVLCLPELCPYRTNIRQERRITAELGIRQAEAEAKMESLRTLLNNTKHLIQRLINRTDQNQRLIDQTMHEILDILCQIDE